MRKVNTCFSTLGCTEKTLEEILNICQEFGIDNLEIRGIGGELDNSNIKDFQCENLVDVKTKFRDNNVRPLILGTSCAFHNKDKYDKAIKEGISAISIAAGLGCTGIRVFGNKLEPDEHQSTVSVINGISELCSRAKDTDVRILLEVHGDFNTVSSLEPITDALGDNEHFGLIWDVCHTHKVYGDKWTEFYKFAKPFIYHVHIKDATDERLTLPGDGDIPIQDIMYKMLEDGYDGAFSLEWEKKWHPELPDITVALERYYDIVRSI